MKSIAFFLMGICCIPLVNAQDKFKFGDVPKELLEMTVYEKDTTASAFVVYENQDVYYRWNNGSSNFELVSEHTVRVKILTSDGVDQANVSISFYK